MGNSDKFDRIESSAGYSRILDYVDLFDEGRFGADKLHLRGSFTSIKDVHDQVNAFLSTNVTDEEAESLPPYSNPDVAREIADYNRLFDPNRKIWKLSNPPKDNYPQKADYRLLFFIKLHFNLDFAYIWFGIPWDETNLPSTPGATTPTKSITDYTINDLQLLRHTWISAEDAQMVLDYIINPTNRDTDANVLNAYSEISGTNIII